MAASKDMRPLQNFGKVFFHNQFRVKIPLLSNENHQHLSQEVAIVTGATSGLGLEAAKQLLSLGLSHLIIAVRSVERGQDAAASARQATNSAAKIDIWALDMDSYESIQAFVQKCENELPRLDYVILNAGTAPTTFTKNTSTGHETTIQVNHLSTALLAIRMLPVLKLKSSSGKAARLTIVNSLTAHLCKFPNRDQIPLLPSFDDTSITPWNAEERYGVSKLLPQLFFAKLSEHASPQTVVINMVDPGLTKGTRLARGTSGLQKLGAAAFFGIAGRSIEQGAATYIHALLGHGVESHGCFLMNDEISPLVGIYYSDDGKRIQDRIWDETIDELRFANADQLVKTMT